MSPVDVYGTKPKSVWNDPWNDPRIPPMRDFDEINKRFEEQRRYYGDRGVNGGGYVPPAKPEMLVVAPDNPIKDIKEFLECFDTSKGATLTIYVDQPVPNKDTPYTFPNNVGHTFISIRQGGNISTYGFYPKKKGSPISPEDVSTLADDAYHSFDVSISIEIDSTTLHKIIDMSINFPKTYNLNTYNYTDFAIEIGNQANLNLPDSFNTWLGGGGSNPGTFGQVLRDYHNNNSNIKVNHEGGRAPANRKKC